jgi:flagellar biosynthetic protein FliR
VLNSFVILLADRIDLAWIFLLFLIRFSVAFSLLPGLGGVLSAATRMPAILVFAATSAMSAGPTTAPTSWAVLLCMALSEAIVGLILGFIPALLVAGFQLAGSLSSTSMGLGTAHLFDPSLGTSVSELSKLYGDVAILIFLGVGGHHTLIFLASGLASQLPPGSFVMTSDLVTTLAQASTSIFSIGIAASAPIIVALLLTQFVLGLLSKSIPTINLFIMSFPLTVGVGLTIGALALPSLGTYITEQVHLFDTLATNILVAGPPTSKHQPKDS